MNKMYLNYFAYGTNRDLAMMSAIIGREKIDGSPAKLLGFELVIQKIDDIHNEILPTAPTLSSPRQIVEQAFGKNFKLYIIRPKINGVTFGVIWQITDEEYRLVREWELLDSGMQQDINAMAASAQGSIINVVTHGSMNQNLPASMIIQGNDYDDYIVPKDDILKVADRVRKEYLERINK